MTGLKLGKAYPIRNVQQAMETKHSVLKGWGQHGLSWGDLMYHESEAMLSAMLELIDDHGIPSLTVHDSLIVRMKDAQVAQGILKGAYRKVCGIEPYLTLKGDVH